MRQVVTKILYALEMMLLCVVILLGIYDILVVIGVLPTSSLSGQVWAVSHKHLVVPFMSGFLCGHFFFSRDN